MKKRYISPAILVECLDVTNQLLADSIGMDFDPTKGGATEPACGKKTNLFGDDEEAPAALPKSSQNLWE